MIRKAHIEFISHLKIKITTPLLQKDFDLEQIKKNDQAIDLVTLKQFKIGSGHKTPLRAEVGEGNGSISAPYRLYILARTDQTKWDEEIGNMSVKEKANTFSVTLPN